MVQHDQRDLLGLQEHPVDQGYKDSQVPQTHSQDHRDLQDPPGVQDNLAIKVKADHQVTLVLRVN